MNCRAFLGRSFSSQGHRRGQVLRKRPAFAEAAEPVQASFFKKSCADEDKKNVSVLLAEAACVRSLSQCRV